MNKKIFIIALILIMPVFLGACQTAGQKVTEKAAENAAEKALEKSTGGNADVDINQGNISVNTDQGSMQTGESVKLPADFPADVYVYEGTIKMAISNNDPKGYSISIESDKTIAEIKAAYEKKIVEDGWKKTGTMDIGTTVTIAGEKDKRTMSVMISDSDGKRLIILGISEKN